ncbi:hypothetical protein BKA62DRAFT_618341 [Auriculariales sp. MPI-PUGE-AT-0066]|nr:hypothetical protein BKA62DRAFT_618341 [Auriculariales sp. MPI-PUGE-AT-0066]
MSPHDGGALSLAAGDTSTAGLSDLNASFLADVPPIAIGILGFAVAKLLFAFNALNRPIILTLLSVLAAFLGVTFDLFRIFQASDDPSDQATRSLLVLREVFLAASIFIRYLFYLEYASRWPDNTTSVENLAVRWLEWPIPRMVLEGILFVLAFIMFVLQLVWRLDDKDPVYLANVVLQICWTAIVMLKMGYSIIVFPDPSLRWRFAKLVLPVMVALLLEWGISIGNAVMRDFADCSAGRFLQAVEVYIIILTLMGVSMSRLVQQGPLSTLPSQIGEKIPRRFAGLSISKPILPQGLPKFSFRVAPRRAPDPPDTEGQQDGVVGQSKFRLSTWLAARLSGGRAAPEETAERRARINLDASPLGTPEIDEWRNRTIARRLSDIAPLPPSRVMFVTNASMDDSQQDSGVDLTHEMPSRKSYFPPPTPPPSMPLPTLPAARTMPSVYSTSKGSTFGHSTGPSMDSSGDRGLSAADPVLPASQRPVSIHDIDEDAGSGRKRDRRSSAPLLSLSLSSPVRSFRALSNPGSGPLTQSIEALLREQDELDLAYGVRTPDPRHSITSTNDGVTSEDSTLPPQPKIEPPPSPPSISTMSPEMTARNSSRSTFSLSKFPAPPVLPRISQITAAPSSFRPSTDTAPTSRFSTSSSGSQSHSDPPPRPISKDSFRPQLTVDTSLRRPSNGSIVGLPANPRPTRGTAWDVTSFISGTRTSIASSSPLTAPPPSTATRAPTSALETPRDPLSTISSSPSPRLPRPPQAPRRNRNVVRASTSIPPVPAPVPRPSSLSEDEEPVLTRTASRARRISRVRFVDTPPRAKSSRMSSFAEGDADAEDVDEVAEVRLAGRAVPLGVGTMPVSMFRAGAAARASALGSRS